MAAAAAAISLVFDRSSPKLVETLGLRLEHIDDVGNVYLEKFKMAVAAISNFEKRLPFLYYLTDRQIITKFSRNIAALI